MGRTRNAGKNKQEPEAAAVPEEKEEVQPVAPPEPMIIQVEDAATAVNKRKADDALPGTPTAQADPKAAKVSELCLSPSDQVMAHWQAYIHSHHTSSLPFLPPSLPLCNDRRQRTR